MSNFHKFTLHREPNAEVIKYWYGQAERDNDNISNPIFHCFISAWISFNALYFPITTAEGDMKSWEEFLRYPTVIEIWDAIKHTNEIREFLLFLTTRDIPNHGIKGGVWNMKKNQLYSSWNFEDNLQNYIGVIYQIRNNLFHGGKDGSDSNEELVKNTHRSFMFFLQKLYGFK